jgi:hypothetical protein
MPAFLSAPSTGAGSPAAADSMATKPQQKMAKRDRPAKKRRAGAGEPVFVMRHLLSCVTLEDMMVSGLNHRAAIAQGKSMKEQRRHQRIRFNVQPLVRLGQAGSRGTGRLENLSLGGLMVRTRLQMKIGGAVGCEFSVLDHVLIDISAVVVGCVGDFCSVRFQAGPVSERLLKDEIEFALSSGKGSAFSMNEVQGRRVMRVIGGLNESLRSDFMHSLSQGGVDEIDLSRVTDIDPAGAKLCRIAAQTHKITIVRPACPVSDEIAEIAGWRPA